MMLFSVLMKRLVFFLLAGLLGCHNGMYQSGIVKADQEAVRPGMSLGLARWKDENHPE